MSYFDCFNGDADGICALTQLRLADPRESKLVTGVKRDINLLANVEASAGDLVTVLDVSLDKNRQGLERILAAGAHVFYCDHHFAGDIPSHENLDAVINTTSDVCTSLLINKRLKNAFLDWAVVGTFGDNLKKSAHVLAKPLALKEADLAELEALGIYLNYNGYGATVDDLYFAPADLYKLTVQHESAFGFINDDAESFNILKNGYNGDMLKAAATKPIYDTDSVAVFEFPNEPWARRVSGVYGNDLANSFPARAHAVITQKADGAYQVSIRAPLNNKQGADEVCRQFETGGGRTAAAGINHLPEAELPRLIDVLNKRYVV